MDFTDINLLDIPLYSIDPMDSMVGIYDKRFLIIYQGSNRVFRSAPRQSSFAVTLVG